MNKLKLSCVALFVFASTQTFAKEAVYQISPDARNIAGIIDDKPVFYAAKTSDIPYSSSQYQSPNIPNKVSDIPTNDGKNTEFSKKLAQTNKAFSEEFAEYGVLLDDDISLSAFFDEINDNSAEEEKLPPSLAEVLAFNPKDELKSMLDEQRYKLIYENAISYGMQSGNAYQAAVIRLALNDRSLAMDNLYNFTRFIMQGRILPPVISQLENRVQQTDDDTIHVGLDNYRILSDARLVTTAPSWRSYLIYAADTPKRPNLALNPEVMAEHELWTKSVAKGFQKGVMLANRNLYESWLQLQRDYLGIITYHELLRKGVVSKPYMTVSTQDIVGDSKNMTVGDAVLRISVKPEFILNRNEWQPNARKGQRGYISGRGAGAEVGEYVKPKKVKKKKVKSKPKNIPKTVEEAPKETVEQVTDPVQSAQ